MNNDRNNQLKKQENQAIESQVIEGRMVDKSSHIKILAKVVIKNAPNLLGAIPFVGDVTAAVIQTTIGATIEYWDELASKKREQEWNSFAMELDGRLSKLEIKAEATDYFENSIIFRFEDIKRKLFTEPGKGFDKLLAEFVAAALLDLNTLPTAKDLILSSLLSVDSVDLKVLQQIDIQMKANFNSKHLLGVKVDVIEALMKSSGIDSIMISRSLQRLQAQDLTHPLYPGTAAIHDSPSKQGVLEGEKSPQFYSGSGFVVSAFGIRFLRFLKLSD